MRLLQKPQFINDISIAFLLHTDIHACNIPHAMTSLLSHPVPPKGPALTTTAAAFISNFLPSGLSSIQRQP